jgi:hypothetical protein
MLNGVTPVTIMEGVWHRDDEHRPAQIEQTHNWRGTCESTPREYIQRISDSVEEVLWMRELTNLLNSSSKNTTALLGPGHP